MRLPPAKELAILALLRDLGESYGLQLVQQSSGVLSRGGVYVLLDRLEEKGMVRSRKEARLPEEGGLPRRLYKITGLGQRALDAAAILRGLPARGIA
jgi:PadR family transcriptional regulator, regulatory protein PadR